MTYTKFIEKIKEEYPEQAIDLKGSIELVKEVLGEIIELSAESMEEVVKQRAFEKMDFYSSIAQEGHEYEKKLETIIDMLDIEDIEIEEEAEESERKRIPNYEAYTVDREVEHSLYDDFKHKRPHGFKLNNQQMIEATSWSSMYIRLCEILMGLDEKKFLSFEHEARMNGKRRSYYSLDKNELKKPYLIANKIYVETNHNANSLRNQMIQLLRAYDFKIHEFKVYFRADYTTMNR